ncbi:hypothetical protein FIV42_26590 [Persicimonas caeni]|uniref:HAMP domain-containing protein n=1 Tax=Persicimonas caeni TaxID=2292766 RepID=A0A4Y6Q124_PERCE|nr:hypothetical protein [Persicimonas caeni]QDG54180.1 hypothetical protein FIV42_26590 [Persicimonas caeni]QED35401.1 hypothetical protein FRD00_26585 [Persicimonas caeni]
MFRAKITLTFVILTSLLLGGVYLIMTGSIASSFEQDAEIAVRRAATIEEQSMRLDEFALIEKAEFTAVDKQLYRRMLLEEDPQFLEQLEAKYPQANNAVDVRHLAVYDEPLTVDKIRLQDVAKTSSGKRNLNLGLYERRPALPDLFLIIDQNGKGVAALGKDNYKWYGDNVAEKYPIILEAIKDNETKTTMWTWSWSESDDANFYRVAIVPIRPDPSKPAAGVVVTGNPIGDGVAKRTQRLMAGITTKGDDIDTVDRADLEAAPAVAFFHGERIVGSTFSTPQEDSLKQSAFKDAKILESDNPEQLLELEVDGEPYVGVVRYFTGEFEQPDKANKSGFIVLSSLQYATKPVGLAMTNIWLLGGAILLVGLIALLFFIQKFVKPAETIEQGIGEILAGNKDYVFELRDEHPIFTSIVQGLNLMSAYLQGKPMPDDAEKLEGWGELIGDSGGSSGGPAKVTGVQMPGMGGGSKKDDDPTDGTT